jgi:hypothetical protein|tara:strand:- start:257 stop:727 length:471 start_codon:yes stop_codon:yes gene_type:complete
MIFSLFKDKKTIQLANQLATTFIRATTILKKIPKDKLTEKEIIPALMKNGVSIDSRWPYSDCEIHIISPIFDVPILINAKLSGDIIIKSDFSKYELNALGINDFKGFGLSIKYDDKKPKTYLADHSLLTNRSSDKPTRKAKFLHEEILKIEGFAGK